MTTAAPSTTPTYPGEDQARSDLAAAHRMAVYDGLAEGTWNHLSVMLSPDTMLITPADRHWSRITPESLTRVTNPEDLPDLPLLFWIGHGIHSGVHRARPDAIAALHVHPPYATALSMLDDPELIPASQLSVEFAGRLAYSDRYDGLAGKSQGSEVAEALGDKTVLLMRGHGVLVAGPSIEQAYVDLYTFERACQEQVLALSTGRSIRPFTDEEVAALRHVDDSVEARRHFDAMIDAVDGGQL
jgi:ribulose-5-phosphate 4-epimerase/fuculose-1-phosphate aldolase